jgi:perosamine synthetase
MASPLRRIPVSQPYITSSDKAAVLDCLDKTYLSGDSPIVGEFEENFAQAIGAEYGIAVANGSVALDLVMHALDLSEGDEVIVPSFTIASCLFAILRTGATPIFVDADEGTWNMSIDTVRSKVSARTKAIMVVHIYGLPVDLDPIIQLCEERNIFLIEDAAEAHGVRYKGRLCGSFGFASTFSFYANKAITTGEGGMVLTSDQDLRDKIKYFRNLAFAPPPGKRFIHEDLGWNYRLGSMQAALGNSQLARMDEIVEAKREIGVKYHTALSAHPLLEMQLTEMPYARNMYWVVGVLLDDVIDSDILASMLKARGVDTRPFFYPLHLQPLLKKYASGKQAALPVTERLAKQGIYLPSYIGIANDDIEYVVEQLHASINEMV